MSFPYKAIQDAGVDVAGAVHENFLNNFSKGHFKAVPKLYKGQVVFNEFQSRVSVAYEIQDPLTFDLTPIPASKIRKVLIAHFNDAKKSANAETYIDAFAPPNVNITGKKVKVTITVYKGQTNDVDFSLDFNWAVDARCLVYFKEYTAEKKAIRLEAIRVAFTKPTQDLLKEIADKLKQIAVSSPNSPMLAVSAVSAKRSKALSQISTRAQLSGPGDIEWCTKLEKLFLFLINQVLGVQFTNFVNEWELPRAIEITKGASITPSMLTVEDNYLIVGAQVNPGIGEAFTELQAAATSVLDQFADQYRQEFGAMTDAEFKAWQPETSQSLKWLSDLEKETNKAANGAGGKPPKKAYDKNIILLANSELFDAIAKSELKASGGSHYEKKLDHLIKAQAGWSFSLGPSSAKIIPGGIEVQTAAKVSGYVRGCLPDPNPKHWGDWRCEGICIELSLSKAFGAQARLSFENDGVYCRFSLKPGSAVEFGFCDAPGWLNDLLGWISALFTRALLNTLSTIISLFKFKMVDYPEHFPGTGLEWKPRLNQTPANPLSYLEISGDPTFT